MSQKFRRNEPMPHGLITDEQIREFVALAEKREMARTGTKQPQARAALSRDLRVGYWTITNLLRGRLKWVRGDLRDKIKAGIIRNLEAEIRRLESELDLVRKCNTGLPEANIVAAQAAIEQARAFLKGSQT